MSKKIIGIYHKDCIDGTSAAAVLLRKFPDVSLFPLSHAYTKADIKPILEQAKNGAKIYTVDCGLGINELLENGHKVTVIDHHIGFKDMMQKIAENNPNAEYIFDNDKSGASLAWSYFFPDEKEPELIRYVEDADLWKWEYGDDTKYVNNYLVMFKDDPKTMLEILEGDLSEIKEKGSIISQYADNEIELLIKTPSIKVKIDGHVVPAYNITTYQSACGNILSDKLGSVVAMFTVQGNNVNLSFRSKEHQSPTSLELAQALGGGGHKCASGADILLKDFLSMIV